MKLKKIFGLMNVQEKLNDYHCLRQRLLELDEIGEELADKFMVQKSIVDGLGSLPESKRTEVMQKHEEFLRVHQKEVSKAINERNKVLKAISKYREDEEISDACKELDRIAMLENAYERGEINKSVFFEVVKAITGEPVKYADVIARNKEGQILVLHRVDDFVPNGKVCIPGGHVDPGEDFETAALRELKEETNLDPIKKFGIKYLGEHKNKEAWIKYYEVAVDDLQPVTVDSSEHCFYEWVRPEDMLTMNFIFDQGRIALTKLFGEDFMAKVGVIEDFAEKGVIPLEAASAMTSDLFKKAMGCEEAKPLMPESMEGSVKRLTLRLRDPDRNFEKLCKAISEKEEIVLGGEKIKFAQPLIIRDCRFSKAPESKRMVEVNVEFTGNANDFLNVIDKYKYQLLDVACENGIELTAGQENFMLVNQKGVEYLGDPIICDV